MQGNRLLAIGLVVVAVVCAAVAILYLTQKTDFLASGRPIHHTSRGLVLAAIAVVCLIAAVFARPRAART
jgi:FtsH-binding integral membrane protein